MTRSTFHRRIAVLLLAALLGEEEGCNRPEVTTVLERTGVSDTPTPPPERIDFACDLSVGSPCSDDTARRNLGTVVEYLWPRVGSRLVVWAFGEQVAETLPIATIDVAPRTIRSERSEREARARFLDSVVQAVCPAIAARTARGRPRQSPIAESLGRIATERTQGMRRRIVVVSDAREVSSLFGNWECRTTPEPNVFVRELERHQLLRPGSLDHARVHFVHVAPDPTVNRRCPLTIEREEHIRELWRTALRRAGALEVSFDLGSFELMSTDHPRP